MVCAEVEATDRPPIAI